jgi:tellurite resistance protein TerC
MWLAFGAIIIVALAVDLKVFHRRPHEISVREATVWSVVWIALSLAFAGYVYIELGRVAATQYLTGYLIEKALSMDNLFVFLIIFTWFGVPAEYQHNVLFWGILGALLFRALFIAAGVGLITALHWTIYILGAFLIYTGVRLAFEKDREFDPERNIAIRLFRRFFPVSAVYDGRRFFTRQGGALAATPLFITLLVLETTDIVFATDSIPAILGITTDPFLVYTSNIFAILGLRALYFLLAGVMRLFRFLHYGLSLILVFVGLKMVTEKFIHLGVDMELGIVLAILALSILASIAIPSKDADP